MIKVEEVFNNGTLRLTGTNGSYWLPKAIAERPSDYSLELRLLREVAEAIHSGPKS